MACLKLIILALVCISAVKNDTAWGKCPDVEYQLESFDVSRYLGKWYEIARAVKTPFQRGECSQALYSLNEEDGTVRVENSEKIGEHRHIAIGKAETTPNPFVLKVSFGESFLSKFFKGDYRVIDTDYENFSIVYSCTDLLIARAEFLWILSRTPKISDEQLINLSAFVANKLGYTPDRLRFTRQDVDFCEYKDE